MIRNILLPSQVREAGQWIHNTIVLVVVVVEDRTVRGWNVEQNNE